MGRHDNHVTPESLTTAVEITIQLDCQSLRAGEADKWILLTDENTGGRCDSVVVVAEAMEVEDMSPAYSFEKQSFLCYGPWRMFAWVAGVQSRSSYPCHRFVACSMLEDRKVCVSDSDLRWTSSVFLCLSYLLG